jgi:predicted aminopeptidase
MRSLNWKRNRYQKFFKQVVCGTLFMSLFAGCGHVGIFSSGYLPQAALGQFRLINRARPIEEVLHDETIAPRTRALLSELPKIREFIQQQGLTVTKNYQSYVQLKQPNVVYVVSAAQELAFVPYEWSFPVVGSFPYLGWFQKDEAFDYAKRLKKELGDWDVDVRGTRAYSTLGWFSDPVLSSMIPDGPEARGELVEVLIHESVHATLYIDRQTKFNETLAQFVGERLTEIYLKQNPIGPSTVYSKGDSKGDVKSDDNGNDAEAYRKAQEGSEKHVRLLHETYEKLKTLYLSQSTAEQKRQQKAQILAQLKSTLQSQRDFNNATLIQYQTYGADWESFETWFIKMQKDWKRMIQSFSQIRKEWFDRPQLENFSKIVEKIKSTD